MIRYSDEVAAARSAGLPLVALESTIISHGLPRPTNLQVAKEVEAIVRDAGAVPATIAVIDGEINVGLDLKSLERLAEDTSVVKASIRDLPMVHVKKLSAATTVAATSHIAHQAGISFFATGGLGGVHRGAQESWDESADLMALATIPILVVCAGAKSILDVPATLERMETLSIPIIGYRTQRFPGFYLADSGFTLDYRADSPVEVASLWHARHAVGISKSGMVIAHPVAKEMDKSRHDQILAKGLQEAENRGVRGKEVTPFLLDFFHSESGGESLRVNIEIIKANARLAAEIAIAAKK
ncbi:MAG: pseudouridine-5'-phosphate glycosidase [Actinobacteria bacterium]|jgi:pseudouridylate synthase|nr:pseudouridine-5'-phosphate glycosidase [Actinomycetota bacterium]NCW35327.1 pseudouridine-5'-phosphate glycosidase [Actinomycetota bacterium]NCZ73252.1 pseudouridine-5'-phosphate glycosidase [Actinomycetota bacterium]NDA41305.1 pseudouridine-5'-phosphate glycosidase [Actinomycetota bacterium]NDB31183.1 pseudouridine-5'-phosphate glycosidase [Actinomycetota bacterium]